jgi:hypothetical protein
MVMRNANIIGATVLFALAVAAAIVWGYSTRSVPRRQASVEVQQMQERAWDVQVKQMPSDVDTAPGDEDKKILAAEH